MLRIRFVLTLLVAAGMGVSAFAGPAALFKKKTDPARVPGLLETLKSDPDEKKRKAAADELGAADIRLNPEVATALAVALQNDASAAVRAEAALSLGQFGQVFALAGQALEAAAANDSSTVVRLAARRTLWEYHLNGYRSGKPTESVTMQTAEPPIASPAGPRPASAVLPLPRASLKPLAPSLPAMPATVPLLPPASSVGPRITRLPLIGEWLSGPRTALRPAASTAPPPILNMTSEPPIAKRPAVTIPPLPQPTSTVPPPTITVAPFVPPAPRTPDYVPTLPPLVVETSELPPVVLPPDATPMPLAPPKPPKIPATLPPLKEPK